MIFSFLQSVVDSTYSAAAVSAPQVTEKTYSLIEMAAKGGWIMIVLGILSLVAIYIFGMKAWTLLVACKNDELLFKEVRDRVLEGRVKSAASYCAGKDSPQARLLEKGLEKINAPLGDIRNAMERVGNAEVARLDKGLPAMASIAGGAPMLGFLGTVTGMIRAFFNMAQAGNNIDITLLSSGIYEAMVTTVGGLIVGLIAYFANSWLNARVGSLTADLNRLTDEFTDLVSEYRSADEVDEEEENAAPARKVVIKK